jgi:hypothetical protein
MFGAIFWLIGLVLGISSVMQAARISQGNSREGWGSAIGTFATGVCMIMLPEFLGSFTASSFGSGAASSAMSYSPSGMSQLGDSGKSMVQTILMWCELFGILAFAKGIMTLRATANGTGPQTYGPGVTFVIAGCLAANITQVISSLASTLGIAAFS